MPGMTKMDIMKLVNRYIGGSGGYLGDFGYRSHAEFYPEFCNLDIDPSTIQDTTRRRFIKILEDASPQDQGKIVRGTLTKYPPDTNACATRTRELHDEFLALAGKLEATSPVGSPTPQITSDVVERAIADAETLISSQGATSGVDRLHTALHGYLKAVCGHAGIAFAADATMNALFRLIREQHPKFAVLGHRAQDITMVMRAMGSIMDAMNPVRNNASMAHPNDNLLETPEAMLVINAARTILHYLDAKLA
jgi:Abortive infection C-terminus